MKKQENKMIQRLKKYQTKRFDYYRTLNEYYIENDEAYISIKVDSLEDIISKYSVKNDEILNYEFTRYLERNASYIPEEYSLVLEVCNHNFTQEEKEIIRKVIRNHYGINLINKEEELKASKRKGWSLFTIGVICLVFYCALIYLNHLLILRELFSLLSCFALWEATDIMLFNNDSLKADIADLQNLSEIKVKFEK